MWISGIIVAADAVWHQLHFSKKTHEKEIEMKQNFTLNQHKLEGKKLYHHFQTRY